MGAFSIPLQARAPEPINPMQTIGGLMQLKSSMVESALREAQISTQQQQMQLVQAEQQQKNRDLADQNTIQEAMKDPDSAKAIAAGDLSGLNGKVQPKTLEALNTTVLDHRSKLATLETTRLGNREKAAGQLAETLNGLKMLGDTDTVNSALPVAVRNLSAAGVFDALDMDMSKVPQTITDIAQLDHFAAAASVEQIAAQKALELKGKQATQAKEEADTAKAQAEAAKARMDAAKTQAILDQTKAGAQPTSGPHPIDAIFQNSGVNDPQSQAAFKAEYDATPLSFGDNPNAGREAVLQRASAHATAAAKTRKETQARLDVENSPEAIAAAAQKAAKEGAARVAAETPGMVSRKVEEEKAMAAQAPEAFRGIIDTPTRNKAIADQIKAADEYSKASAEAQQLENYVKAAKSGNQAAAGNVPLAAVRSLVNRVNRQELEAQGGQSWARRILDYADKGITGAPSADTLNDFAQLAGISRTKAASTYGGVTDNINALGGKVARIPPGGVTTPKTQKEYDDLPKGAQFMKPNDPKVYTKN